MSKHYYIIILRIESLSDNDHYQLKLHIRDENNKINMEKFKKFRGSIQIAESYDYFIMDVCNICGDDYRKIAELDHLMELVDYTKNPKKMNGEYNRFYIRTGLAGDTFDEAEEVTEVKINDGEFRYCDQFDHILCDINIDQIIEYVNRKFIEIV